MGILDRQVSETQIKLRSRLWLYILSAVLLFLLIVPSLIVIPMSFSGSQYLEFPPKNWSLRWYENYFFSWKVENGFNDWMAATRTSLLVAVLTIFVATPIGTLAAYGLTKQHVAPSHDTVPNHDLTHDGADHPCRHRVVLFLCPIQDGE